MKKLLFFLFAVCVVLGSCSSSIDDSTDSASMFGDNPSGDNFPIVNPPDNNSPEDSFPAGNPPGSSAPEDSLHGDNSPDGSAPEDNLHGANSPDGSSSGDSLPSGSGGTRNNRIPKLVINEICTEFSRPGTEFIEFKMMTAGNLGAMRVIIAGNNAPVVYEFLPVEVKDGEYVTLHLRTIEAYCKDEYGSNLSESGGRDSSPTGRDFWIPGSEKILHRANAAIYVLDQDDRVLDAVMISEKPDLTWGKKHLTEAAEFLFQQGAWKSVNGKVCRPADAVISNNATATRTICRDETVGNTGTAADWYITATSGLTPGGENNPKRFEQ